jgi:hypothetical protein
MIKAAYMCKECKKTKPISEFYLVTLKTGAQYPRSRCKPCYNTNSLKAFSRHPEWLRRMHQRKKEKRAALPFRLETLRAMNLTIEKAFEIYTAQKGLCAVCHKPPGKHRLALDHDHKTGKPRQFLCAGCNSDLAVLESGEHLKKLQDYLEKHRCS